MTQKEIQEWLAEWVLLFPEGVQFGGYNLRSKPEDCYNKMLRFCKDHPQYTKDCIFTATKQYLLERFAKNWEYTKQATYFISKMGQPSLLEQYCERVLAGVKPPEIQQIIEHIAINDFI